MSDKKKSVIIHLIARTDQFTKAMDRASKQMTAIGKKLEASGRAMTMSVTAPIVAMAALSVKAFAEEEQAIAKMNAAIQANGKNVAAVSADYVKFAAELQKTTIVGDDTTLGLLQLAESMRAADPKKAVEGAIALSRALGIDLESATKMAVQAQNGQYTMLQRYVPALRAATSEAEKHAIVQKLFADGMKVAEAEAETTSGRLLQLKNAVGDLMENFGKIIAGYITPFIKRLRDLTDRFQNLTEEKKKNILRWAGLLAAIGPVLWISGKLITTLASVARVLGTTSAILSLSMKVFTGGAGAVKAFTIAWKGLSVAMKASIIGIAVTAVVYAVAKIKQALAEKNKAVKESIDADREQAKELLNQVNAIHAVFAELKQTTAGSKERLKVINKINETYGTTLKNYSDEKKAIKEIDEAYNTLIETTIKQIKLEGTRKALIQALEDEQTALIGVAIAHGSYGVAAEAGFEKAQKWIKEAEQKSKNATQAVANLAKHVVSTQSELDNLLKGGDKPKGGDKLSAFEKLSAEVAKYEAQLKNAIALGASFAEKDTIISNLDNAKKRLEDVNAQFEALTGWREKLKVEPLKIEVDIDDIYEYQEILMETPAMIQKVIDQQLRWEQSIENLNQMFEKLIEDTLVKLGEAIGQAISGGDVAKVFDSFMLMLADFGQQLGEYLIQYGVLIEAFDLATKQLNPYVAIAAGIAMVAMAQAIKNEFSNAPGYALGTNFAPGGLAVVGERGPEMIELPRGAKVHPNMNFNSMMPIIAAVAIRGNDLQLTFDRTNKRQGRYR